MTSVLRFIAFFSFLLVWPSFSVVAQNSGRLARIDSLKAIKAISLESQYAVHLNLCYEYADFNDHLAYQCSNKAFEVAIELSDSSKIASSARLQGLFMKKMGDIDGAIEKYEFAFGVAARNNLTQVLSLIYVSLPTPYVFKSEYQRALAILFESVDFFDKHNNPVMKSYALNNIGLVYFRIESYSKALDYFNQSLVLRKKNHDNYDVALLLNNIALSHANLGGHREAIRVVLRGLDFCKSSCSPREKMLFYLTLGEAHAGLREYEVAKTCFEKAGAYAGIAQDQNGEAGSLIGLGKLALANKSFAQALGHFVLADKVKNKNRETELTVLKELGNVYTAIDSFKQAALYQARYIKVRNGVYTNSLTDKLILLQERESKSLNRLKILQQNEVLQLTGSLVEVKYLTIAGNVIASLMLLVLIVLMRQISVKEERLINSLEDIVELKTAHLKSSVDNLNRDHLDLQTRRRDHLVFVKNQTRTAKGLAQLDVPTEIRGKFLTVIDKLPLEDSVFRSLD